jgi:hypothetical protein
MSQASETETQTIAEAQPRPNASHRAPGQASETDPARDGGRILTTDLLRRQMAHCGEFTFQALNKIGKLSPGDSSRITQQYLRYLNSVEKGKPFTDPLHFLYFEGWKRPEIDARDMILRLTRSLIAYSKTKINHLAFAKETDTPIEFYNSYPTISEICRLLGAPIIQVNEKDFFTITSVNPFTATSAARLVSNEIEQEVGRKPFCFVTTTDFNAWQYLIGRHFGA